MKVRLITITISIFQLLLSIVIL